MNCCTGKPLRVLPTLPKNLTELTSNFNKEPKGIEQTKNQLIHSLKKADPENHAGKLVVALIDLSRAQTRYRDSSDTASKKIFEGQANGALAEIKNLSEQLAIDPLNVLELTAENYYFTPDPIAPPLKNFLNDLNSNKLLQHTKIDEYNTNFLQQNKLVISYTPPVAKLSKESAIKPADESKLLKKRNSFNECRVEYPDLHTAQNGLKGYKCHPDKEVYMLDAEKATITNKNTNETSTRMGIIYKQVTNKPETVETHQRLAETFLHQRNSCFVVPIASYTDHEIQVKAHGDPLGKLTDESDPERFNSIANKITPEHTAKLITQMKELHQNGFIHGDLDPSNVFYSTQHGFNIIDFGATRHQEVHKIESEVFQDLAKNELKTLETLLNTAKEHAPM